MFVLLVFTPPLVSRAAGKVKLSAAAKRDLAAKAGVPTPQGSMQQLAIPLAVSGLAPKRINRLQKDADSAISELLDHPQDHAGLLDAQCGRRFIEHGYLRAERAGPGHGDRLTLTTG